MCVKSNGGIFNGHHTFFCSLSPYFFASTFPTKNTYRWATTTSSHHHHRPFLGRNLHEWTWNMNEKASVFPALSAAKIAPNRTRIRSKTRFTSSSVRSKKWHHHQQQHHRWMDGWIQADEDITCKRKKGLFFPSNTSKTSHLLSGTKAERLQTGVIILVLRPCFFRLEYADFRVPGIKRG